MDEANSENGAMVPTRLNWWLFLPVVFLEACVVRLVDDPPSPLSLWLPGALGLAIVLAFLGWAAGAVFKMRVTWFCLLFSSCFAFLIGTQNLRAADGAAAPVAPVVESSSPPVAAAVQPTPATPSVSAVSGVQQAAWQCLRSGGDLMGCYVSASPQRCKAAAVNMVGNPDLFRRTWGRCVVSCEKASWWDRHVGDCRK